MFACVSWCRRVDARAEGSALLSGTSGVQKATDVAQNERTHQPVTGELLQLMCRGGEGSRNYVIMTQI